ncbi:MAG: nitroreductase family protein [Candidatus Thiodiazotropha sp.]
MNHTPDYSRDHYSGGRKADHPISSLFLQRWSPRAFDASSMPEADLLTLLEAARWAPSAYNIQPWRFVYVLRDDSDWERYLALLDPFNADWAGAASALLFLVSDRLMPNDRGAHPPARSQTHSFDAGAAWAHLALQATALGYQAHAMAGIRFEVIRQRLSIPDNYRIEIAVAIGRLAAPSRLPSALRQRETPSSRLPLDRIAFAGRFPSQSTQTPRKRARRG